MGYTATEFSTVEDKKKFEAQFKKFVTNGFQKKHFPKWFYTRLSMCFGHIAHYSQSGFYYFFFEDDEGKRDFLNWTMNGGGYGDPAYTYSDVENNLKKWLNESEFLLTV